jgi:hypothetical protein
MSSVMLTPSRSEMALMVRSEGLLSPRSNMLT